MPNLAEKFNQADVITLEAEAALSTSYLFCKQGTAAHQMTPCTANSDYPLWQARDAASADDPTPALPVRPGQILTAKSDGTIDGAVELTCSDDASYKGGVEKATSGDIVFARSFGAASTAGQSVTIVTVIPYTKP